MAERPASTAQTALDTLYRTAEALLAHTSETASMALAELVVRRYGALKPAGRREFLTFLLKELGPSRPDVDLAIDLYRVERSEASLARLFQAVEPRRQALFRAINTAPGGTWTVLTMRADL